MAKKLPKLLMKEIIDALYGKIADYASCRSSRHYLRVSTYDGNNFTLHAYSKTPSKFTVHITIAHSSETTAGLFRRDADGIDESFDLLRKNCSWFNEIVNPDPSVISARKFNSDRWCIGHPHHGIATPDGSATCYGQLFSAQVLALGHMTNCRITSRIDDPKNVPWFIVMVYIPSIRYCLLYTNGDEWYPVYTPSAYPESWSRDIKDGKLVTVFTRHGFIDDMRLMNARDKELIKQAIRHYVSEVMS